LEATKIEVRNLGDTVVISVDGLLVVGVPFQISGDKLSSGDMWVTNAIAQLIAQQVSKGAKKIVVDLTHCNSLDSSAIGYLVIASSKLRKEGGKIAVAASPDSLPLEILELTSTTKILPVYESVESAAQALEGAKTM
jgi:anti-anti-sigma factor